MAGLTAEAAAAAGATVAAAEVSIVEAEAEPVGEPYRSRNRLPGDINTVLVYNGVLVTWFVSLPERGVGDPGS